VSSGRSSVRKGYSEPIARLGRTDLDVYGLCLGGNVFGWTIDEERSFAVLDAYAAAGGNFIDTADTYGRRGPGGAGESERIIGRWMAARGNRDRLVIATKVGVSPELRGLSAGNVRKGAEASLQRLGVERIDLYYAHQDDPDTPLEETLGAFGELIEAGLIGHAGASNYSAERLRLALELGRDEGMASLVALQPHYNLLEREYERELAPLCLSEGLACVPYYGLARGFLSGKYRPGGEPVSSPRAAGVAESYANERGFAVLRALDEIAQAHGVAVASVSLAWLRAQPSVAAPIASATSPGQLAELVASVEMELAPEELARLDAASS
jgi:aryl-alcohol dehydrogenase-like predicted oxidoreductase